MRIAYASCKNCSTRSWLIVCSLSMTRKELLVCDVETNVLGIFIDPLGRHLLARDYTVVSFCQPIFSWPQKPTRITTMVPSVVGRFFLHILETIHIIRAWLRDIIPFKQTSIDNIALVIRSICRFLMPTCSGHALSSSARTCAKNRPLLALPLVRLHNELWKRARRVTVSAP